jgi:hypothetical protein
MKNRDDFNICKIIPRTANNLLSFSLLTNIIYNKITIAERYVYDNNISLLAMNNTYQFVDIDFLITMLEDTINHNKTRLFTITEILPLNYASFKPNKYINQNSLLIDQRYMLSVNNLLFYICKMLVLHKLDSSEFAYWREIINSNNTLDKTSSLLNSINANLVFNIDNYIDENKYNKILNGARGMTTRVVPFSLLKYIGDEVDTVIDINNNMFTSDLTNSNVLADYQDQDNIKWLMIKFAELRQMGRDAEKVLMAGGHVKYNHTDYCKIINLVNLVKIISYSILTNYNYIISMIKLEDWLFDNLTDDEYQIVIDKK